MKNVSKVVLVHFSHPRHSGHRGRRISIIETKWAAQLDLLSYKKNMKVGVQFSSTEYVPGPGFDKTKVKMLSIYDSCFKIFNIY